MRIAINGLACSRSMTGVGRTTLQTLRALLAIDPRNEYLLYLPGDRPDDLGLDAPNLERIETDVSLSQPIRSVLFEEFTIPRRLRGAKVDLYYAPSYLLPAFPGSAAELICVHDLAWRLHPSTKSGLFRAYMNARLPSALRRARRIVCVSNSTREDLLRVYPKTDASRVRVVHNGVDPSVFRPGRDERADPPFVVVVGNQDPRKNLGTMLDAFPRFRARLRQHRLVLVGPGNPPAPKPPAVDFIGYLAEPELASLYRRASMVVQPSIYEGFGLPVLEAMACGTPVACADIPVFREVAEDCALFFDPRDPGSIAAAMEAVASEQESRDDRVRRGLLRARTLTWEETARKLLRLFEEAA